MSGHSKWSTIKRQKGTKDFLQLGGSLKTKIKASPGQIRRAFEGYLAKEAVIHAKA